MHRNLNFSHNWNNKLECTAFTTIRLMDNLKYVVNQLFIPVLQNSKKETVKEYPMVFVAQVKPFYLHELNDYMAYIDTGYNKGTCATLIQTMYKNKNINWQTQQLVFVLLVRQKQK